MGAAFFGDRDDRRCRARRGRRRPVGARGADRAPGAPAAFLAPRAFSRAYGVAAGRGRGRFRWLVLSGCARRRRAFGLQHRAGGNGRLDRRDPWADQQLLARAAASPPDARPGRRVGGVVACRRGVRAARLRHGIRRAGASRAGSRVLPGPASRRCTRARGRSCAPALRPAGNRGRNFQPAIHARRARPRRRDALLARQRRVAGALASFRLGVRPGCRRARGPIPSPIRRGLPEPGARPGGA